MHTQAGSPMYRVPVVTQYSGPQRVKGDWANIARVMDTDGTIYEIVVNPRTGRVPEEAIIEHMLNAGRTSGGKRSVTGDMVRGTKRRITFPPGGFTPEEIVASGWWQDPGSCDIVGIDDGTSKDMPKDRKLRRAAGGRILIRASKKDKAAIESILSESFTEDELRAAARAGVHIRKYPGTAKVGGEYIARQITHETPMIQVKRADPDVVAHEFVHHLRFTDPSRTGLNRHYESDDIEVIGPGGVPKGFSADTISNFEEAMTVAESHARLDSPPTHPTGYYGDLQIYDRSHRDMSDEDWRTITGTKPFPGPKRGKPVLSALEQNFDRTNISRLRRKGRGMSAADFAKELRSDRATIKGSRTASRSTKSADDEDEMGPRDVRSFDDLRRYAILTNPDLAPYIEDPTVWGWLKDYFAYVAMMEHGNEPTLYEYAVRNHVGEYVWDLVMAANPELTRYITSNYDYDALGPQEIDLLDRRAAIQRAHGVMPDWKGVGARGSASRRRGHSDKASKTKRRRSA